MLNAVFHKAIKPVCLFARRAYGKNVAFFFLLFRLHLFPFSKGPYALCFICFIQNYDPAIPTNKSCGEKSNLFLFLQVPIHTSF